MSTLASREGAASSDLVTGGQMYLSTSVSAQNWELEGAPVVVVSTQHGHADAEGESDRGLPCRAHLSLSGHVLRMGCLTVCKTHGGHLTIKTTARQPAWMRWRRPALLGNCLLLSQPLASAFSAPCVAQVILFAAQTTCRVCVLECRGSASAPIPARGALRTLHSHPSLQRNKLAARQWASYCLADAPQQTEAFGTGFTSSCARLEMQRCMQHPLCPNRQHCAHLPAGLWEAQTTWLQHALARMALGIGLLAAVATVAANVWGVPVVNRRLLWQIQASAAALLQREVTVGAVRWVAPTGLLGLTPLVCLGPVTVGPGCAEGSSAQVQRLTVGLDNVQSLLQRRVVLTVRAHQARVELVQGPNYSWFGYPEDTTPSARNFLPGASRAGRNGGSSSEDPGSGGSSDGGHGSVNASGPSPCSQTSSNAGGSATSSSGINSRRSSAMLRSGHDGPSREPSWSARLRNCVLSAGDTAAAAAAESSMIHTWQRMEEAASHAVQSSSELKKLADLLTQQVQWDGFDQPLHACYQQGNAVMPQASGAEADLDMPYLLQHEVLLQSPSNPNDRSQQHGGCSSPAQQRQEVARASADSGGMVDSKPGWPLGKQPPPTPLQRSAKDSRGVAQPQADGTPLPSHGHPHDQHHVAALNRLRLEAGRGYSLCKQGLTEALSQGPSRTASTQAAKTLLAAADMDCGEPGSACSDLRRRACHQQSQPQQPHQKAGRQAVGALIGTQSPQTAGQRGGATDIGRPPGVPQAHPEMVHFPLKLGTAATLNKHVRPLERHSSKLYHANAKHPLERLASKSAAEAAIGSPTVPAPATAITSGEVAAAATDLAMTKERLCAAVQRINSMPVLASGSRHAQSLVPASESVTAVAEQRTWSASKAAIAGLNSIGTLTVPECLQPSARVRGSAGGAFMSQVVDPATTRKKGAFQHRR